MRILVRGDVDGFFGLLLDNLVQLLVIATLCGGLLGFSDELLYGRILPGVGVSLVLGNLFYAWQAWKVARVEGRDDVCALPYGINTPSVFAYIFLVMLPVKLSAEQAGAEDPSILAWRAGLLACVGSGAIELLGAFIAGPIRRSAPRAALLSTLSGIALGFISLGFLLRTFAVPIVGLSTLGIILLGYFGRVRFRGGLPIGLVAVGVGTALWWSLASWGPEGLGLHATPRPSRPLDLALPVWLWDELRAAFDPAFLREYAAVILPMGLFNLIGSLQNIEAAEAAGDRFGTTSSLAVNGIGTLSAAAFGSCFPTTIYIGHAGWKAMGARAGYSVLNAICMTGICLTGAMSWIAWAIPIEAGMAIVLWIGIIITAQAFQATPMKHASAVVIGILPGVAAWGAMLAKGGIRAAAAVFGQDAPLGEEHRATLEESFNGGDIFIHGAFALESGFIFTAMLMAAATVAIIERRFLVGAVWCWIAAALSAVGLMHTYQYTGANTALQRFEPATQWAIGYAAMGLILAIAPIVTKKIDGGEAGQH